VGDIIENKLSSGKISYRARVRRKGEAVITKSFRRKTDAQKWIGIVEADLLKGHGLPKTYRKTLKEAIEQYKIDVVPRKKASTQYVQKHMLEFWVSELGERRLDDINYDDLSKAQATLRATKVYRKGHKEPQSRGDASINRYFAVLRHVFSIALKKWKWTRTNPVLEMTPLYEGNGRTRILSNSELKTLLEKLESHPRKDFRLIVHITLITGCRRGNAQSIHWEHVDLFGKTILFPDTKNNTPHVVPITQDLCDDLIAYKKISEQERGPIFPSKPGSHSPYVDVKQIWRKFASVHKFDDLHFHDLRHSVASFLAKQNVSLFSIGRLLGHKSLESTKRYAHMGVADVAPYVEQLGARLKRVK
jgi:integrase